MLRKVVVSTDGSINEIRRSKQPGDNWNVSFTTYKSNVKTYELNVKLDCAQSYSNYASARSAAELFLTRAEDASSKCNVS